MPTSRTSYSGQVWRTYIETSILLETRLDEDLRSATGLSMVDYHVLLVLSETPGRRLRMGELAQRMVFSPSRLTYQVRSMEKSGFVVRQAAADDKRVNYAVLTAEGLEALRAAAPHHLDTVRKLFTDDLSDDELHVLADVFGRLRNRLTTGEADAEYDPTPRTGRPTSRREREQGPQSC